MGKGRHSQWREGCGRTHEHGTVYVSLGSGITLGHQTRRPYVPRTSEWLRSWDAIGFRRALPRQVQMPKAAVKDTSVLPLAARPLTRAGGLLGDELRRAAMHPGDGVPAVGIHRAPTMCRAQPWPSLPRRGRAPRVPAGRFILLFGSLRGIRLGCSPPPPRPRLPKESFHRD